MFYTSACLIVFQRFPQMKKMNMPLRTNFYNNYLKTRILPWLPAPCIAMVSGIGVTIHIAAVMAGVLVHCLQLPWSLDFVFTTASYGWKSMTLSEHDIVWAWHCLSMTLSEHDIVWSYVRKVKNKQCVIIIISELYTLQAANNESSKVCGHLLPVTYLI